MTARALSLRIPRSVGIGLRAGYWSVVSALSGLLIANSLPYFGFAADLPFLLEKGEVARGMLWRGTFYVHVAGGMVCLASALPQFSRTLLRRLPAVHRALGWTYVVSVLVFTAPTGLYLALFAKGGMPGRLGFILLGVALFYTTWRGFERVRARDFRGHVAWMIRSYALTASALTFRVFHLALYLAGVGGEYVLAIWLSLVVNLAVAECVVLARSKGAFS